MITLEEFLKAINYKITGGSEFQWAAYGPNARYLDSEDTTHTINAIYDSATQFVYAVEAWDYTNDRAYRWISANYIDAYKTECLDRGIDFDNASDDLDFITLETADDILEKATAIANGEEYDTRVKVPLDLPKDELFQLMMLAHDRDITLNNLVVEALQNAIDEYERDPIGMKARAQEFVNNA